MQNMLHMPRHNSPNLGKQIKLTFLGNQCETRVLHLCLKLVTNTTACHVKTTKLASHQDLDL